MIRALFFAVAAFATSVSPALASDGLRFYAGPLAGYDHVTITLPDFDVSDAADGLAYGGTIGVDAKVATDATFGVEAEYMGSNTDRTVDSAILANDRLRVSAGRDYYVGVRGAYFLAPRVIAYAKVGYTNARINVDYTDPAGVTDRAHVNRGGVRFGPGVEFVISRNIGLRAEYRRSEYKEYTLFGERVGGHRDQVIAGLVAGF